MRHTPSYLFLLFLAASALGCQKSAQDEAQRIVNQAIRAHGMQELDQSIVEFDFRDRHYRATKKEGLYTYERIFTDTLGQVHDSLTNAGFSRYVNGIKTELNEKKASSYGSSVNSVIYFTLLPYFLNDPAVQKELLGESQINGEKYNKIKVTFQQNGGGSDFQDEYVYWFHKEKHTMDYLAYNYQENGGGARFRVAFNPQTIDGVRFADYINLKPKEKDNLAVETFDSLYQAKELIELSRIINEDIKVHLIN